ncbi:MAG: toll/interleukin-1 receptor domain-containing protein, partial [Clostridia bacterium]|nr:toll/interleukin-1 receptor domain-containing protein [Clostridia bacterium]
MANKKGFICEGCGAALDYTLYKGGIIECKYCFRQNTVPKEDIDDDAKQLMFNGKFSLKARKFDDARLAFRELAEKNPEEAEAYWGMALAEFNVQYIYDINKEGEDKLQVLCKEVDKKFTDSDNYKKALKYASEEQKKVYKKKGEDIDTVREQFLHFKDEQNLEYDCFICVKVTEELLDKEGNKVLDDKGKPRTKKTYDSTMAAEVYSFLKEKGFKPFYSEKEIKGRTGEAYEAMILYALYKSECMLVVCSDEKYLQTPWVKSEYTRFLELINDKEKASTSITTIFDGNPIDRLDGKNGRIQGIDKNRADWENLLYDYVMDHSPTGRKRKQEAQAKREAEEAEKRRIVEEERRRKEEEERKNKEAIAAMQAKIDEMSQTKTAPLDKIGSMNAKKIIKFAYDLLDGRRFEQAYENFNEVLKMDSDNCDAWWGMFLVEMKVVDGDEILKKIDAKLWKEIQSNPFYIKACAKAEQSSKDEKVDLFNKKVKCGQISDILSSRDGELVGEKKQA